MFNALTLVEIEIGPIIVPCDTLITIEELEGVFVGTVGSWTFDIATYEYVKLTGPCSDLLH
jgi:hypothetical protein